jgi:uncharacterized protein (TIGR02611 family)
MEFKRPHRTPRQRMLVLVSGWGLIILGAIGGLIPVLQGWVFGVAGLLVLSTEYEWAHNLLMWLRRKFPRFARVMERVKAESTRIFDKVMRRAGSQRSSA